MSTALSPRNTGTLKLATAGDGEIIMTRVFDAPRSKVFDAYTKPEQVKRWMGPHGWSLVTCEIDLKVGGAYRFEGRGARGNEMGWGGVYREIVRPERLVFTEKFDEPWYPGEALITMILTEQNGRTTFTGIVRYASREAREIVLKTRMEHGVAESYDRLADTLTPEEVR
jgi:uncharacterized protein YndB with AHSA1/START domain